MLRYRFECMRVLTLPTGASEARGQVFCRLRRTSGMGQGERVPVGLQHRAHVGAVLLLVTRQGGHLPQPRPGREPTEGAYAQQGRVDIVKSTQPSSNRRDPAHASV